MNKCVGLRAGGAHENTSASSVSPLQLWGTSARGGGGSLSWSPVAVFPETGFECRSGHLELLSWIYCVGGGQGQAVRLLRPPSLLNTRTQLASDMEQTLAARTNPCHAL